MLTIGPPCLQEKPRSLEKKGKTHQKKKEFLEADKEIQENKVGGKHPSRDVIFSGQNLLQKRPKTDHIIWRYWAFKTSTFGMMW